MTTADVDIIPVEVRPFKHQVGGHTCVLEVGKSTICKPFIDREVWFYEHVPDTLKEFIPKYLGETLVTCDISDTRKYLVAMIPRDVAARDGLVENGKRGLRNDAGVPVKRRKRDQVKKENQKACWSDICVDRQILRYGFWANNQPQKFILLENLVHCYKRPCMMDIKMGRRQYGEDSDDAKRKLLESRCARTTSATLGFRICGSKTYQASSDSYIFHDKYYGRDLNDDQAADEIRQFFHNGQCLRSDAIKQIITKLDHLHDVLISQTELYFHSASLLLLYDGRTKSSAVCDVITQQTETGNQSTNVDQSQSSTHIGYDESSNETVQCLGSCGTGSAIKKNVSTETQMVVSNGENRQCENKITVDVRLIDFAHVSQNPTSVTDSSILFGLRNMRDILRGFLEE